MTQTNYWKSDKGFALIVAAVITILSFSAFFGQYFFSDVVTFQRTSDGFQSCYPAFLQVGELFSKGIVSGADVSIYNGSNDLFFYFILSRYLPYTIFALLGYYTEPMFCYLILHAVHLFFYVYFAQRLTNKFWGLNRWISLIFAVSLLRLYFASFGFTAFTIIVSLTTPLFYFTLNWMEFGSKKRELFLTAIPYIFAMTSGYSTASCALAGVGLVTSIVYGISRQKKLKYVILKSILPFAIAFVVALPYLLVFYCYVKYTVCPTILDMASALLLSNTFKNLNTLLFFSGAPYVNTALEQMYNLQLGMIWTIIIVLFFKQNIVSKLKISDKIIFWFGIVCNLTLYFISTGSETPLGAWFYSFVPVFGSMHLPMRYTMATAPLLYLSLCIGLSYLKIEKGEKWFKYLALSALGCAIIISIICRHPIYNTINLFSKESDIIIELLYYAFILSCFYYFGLFSKRAITSWCVCTFLIIIHIVYTAFGVTTHSKYTVEQRSIVFNDHYTEKLDDFVNRLKPKRLYRYLTVEADEGVPIFIPGMKEWYGTSRYNMSNYIGYGIHFAAPKKFMDSMKLEWFNRFDWQYVLDTRIDYVLIAKEKFESYDPEFLNTIIDWEIGAPLLNENYYMCPIRKFVPTYYSEGVEYVLDNPNSLDNGYFYSPFLSNSNLTEFKTDNATYYSGIINTEQNVEVAFLLFPNENYKYYIDKQEVTPIIENGRVYIPVSSGSHLLEIKYRNWRDLLSVIFLYGYFSICFIGIIILKIKILPIKKAKK